MTSLGVRRCSSQWKGESKGVVVKLFRERASEGWKQFLVSLCVCYRQLWRTKSIVPYMCEGKVLMDKKVSIPSASKVKSPNRHIDTQT